MITTVEPVPPTPRESGHPEHEASKAVRKRRKQEAKLRIDAERPPKSLERWRILMDVVDEGRRMAELADHKARYALVVMGVLNAGVLLVLSRAHLLSDLSSEVTPWLLGFLVIYAGLTCLFVFHAVDCLRPRRLRGRGPSADGAKAHGLLHWEFICAGDLASYQRAWSTVRMEQLTGEVVVISHHLAGLIAAKYRALGRLYGGLKVLVVLAALQLIVYAGFALAE